MKHFTLLLGISVVISQAFAQTIGSFSSVEPKAQDQWLNLPTTHTFQLLLQSGYVLSDNTVLGNNLDFTSFVALNGSSTQGYMTVNSETEPASVAAFDVSFDMGMNRWQLTNSESFDFTGMGTVSKFCSGGVMPWGTVIIGEETINSGDVNLDGYLDAGWLIELNPANRTIVTKDGTGGNSKDKVWAAGRTTHENICVSSDHKTFYFGADNPTNGFLYKFVSDEPQDLTSGSLYVLQTTGGLFDQTTGKWIKLPNTTKAERNNTHFLAADSGATNFDGIEDVEIGPDGRVYFTAKGLGRIYRFQDNGTFGQSTDVTFEIYVDNKLYDVDDTGPFAPEPWGIGNDNLAFDGEGNLWVLQDGGRNHIWVVGPAHIAGGDNDIRLFATTPLNGEPTGINFTPDYKFMFISFQHPAPANTVAQKDAFDVDVTFNTHSTIVISRKENFGVALSVMNSSLPPTWKLSPNPADAELRLTTPTFFNEIHVEILDSGGKLVKEEKLQKGNEFTIAIHSLKAGNYQLHITGKGVDGVVKFVKK